MLVHLVLGSFLTLQFSPLVVSQAATSPEGSCNATIDLILVIDSSSSKGFEKFQLELEVFKTLTQIFTLGPSNTAIGAVTYSQDEGKMFDLKDLTDHQSLSTVLLATPYLNNSNNLYKALNLISGSNLFSTENGGRENALDVVFVIIDDVPNRPIRTRRAARNLKANGVVIHTLADQENERGVRFSQSINSGQNYTYTGLETFCTVSGGRWTPTSTESVGK